MIDRHSHNIQQEMKDKKKVAFDQRQQERWKKSPLKQADLSLINMINRHTFLQDSNSDTQRERERERSYIDKTVKRRTRNGSQNSLAD